MTTTDLTLLHDSDLEHMGTAEARKVLAERKRGARLVRSVLARMYGHTKAATSRRWEIVPHVTAEGTIGIVNVAHGTAWDSGVPAGPDVAALGLDDLHTPDANHPSLAGDIRFDGELVQRAGETPGKPITAPEGWLRIGLATFQGTQPDPSEYEPRETWIRPTLRAFGLTTCYGTTGRPRRTLGDAAGWGSARPWIPEQFERVSPEWWPCDEDQRRELERMAAEWLDGAVRQLMDVAGLPADHPARSAETPAHTKRLLWESRPGQGDYPPPGPLRAVYSALSGVTPDPLYRALRNAWVTRIAEIDADGIGARVDIMHDMLSRALWGPAETVATALGQFYPDDATGRHNLVREVTSIAEHAANSILAAVHADARDFLEHRTVDRYYEMVGAPVYVEMPASYAS